MGRKGLLTQQRKAEVLEQISGVKGLWEKSEVVVKAERDWSATYVSAELSSP